MTYDPAFMNTASTRSTITFIDGDQGILEYRGYPIEQLAEHSTFLEVAYLLLRGELPDRNALEEWTWQITHHTQAPVITRRTRYCAATSFHDEEKRRQAMHRFRRLAAVRGAGAPAL